jgi:hypothetical protein
MTVSSQTTINADELKKAYDSRVIDFIRSSYSINYSPSSLPFDDMPSELTGILSTVTYPSLTSSLISSSKTITASAIRDAFIGNANTELTRYRNVRWTRNVTASGKNRDGTIVQPTSEQKTGISGRLSTTLSAPGFSNPSSIDDISSELSISSSSINNFLDGIRNEWINVSVNTTLDRSYSVCHNSCHNNCHGSRGRR